MVNKILQRHFSITSSNASRSLSHGNCPRPEKSLHFGRVLHNLCNDSKGTAPGGDCYSENGTGQCDRVLPQNRSGQRGTGTAGIRCPCCSSAPAAEITELPHKPKTGTAGCGHQYRKKTKQGTDFMTSPFPAFSMPQHSGLSAGPESRWCEDSIFHTSGSVSCQACSFVRVKGFNALDQPDGPNGDQILLVRCLGVIFFGGLMPAGSV